MVGRGGVEPPTSRLSGVRSNHLSYRPHRTWQAHPNNRASRGRREPAQAYDTIINDRVNLQLMKGHEDDGNVL